MWNTRTLLCVILGTALLENAGCKRSSHAGENSDTTHSGSPAVIRQWTPEEIARDPEGYLTFAAGQVQIQIKQREAKLAAIRQRHQEIRPRYQDFADNLAQVKNVHDRLVRACQQADDEDHWPVKIGGRSFEKDKAQAVIESTKRYVDDREPLLATYDDAMGKLEDAEGTVGKDISDLGRLAEKIALDLERVRLNKGLAELADMRKTEADLATFAKALADMSEDPTADINLVNKDKPQVDVEQLLK